MTSEPKQQELLEFIRKHLIATAATIVIFFAVAGVLVVLFEQQIVGATAWIDKNFGFWGLAALLFVGDTFVSPVPPDVLMLIISKGPMLDNWALYVFGFGLVSSLAGINGYFIGVYLSHRKWALDFSRDFREKHGVTVKRYGFWALAVGALTPFPFSITCWSAGFLGLSAKIAVPACFLRVPRFFLYYFAIHYGTKIFNL